MHIAYLTPEYPHERTGTSGGMGTSIKNLVSELVKGNKIKISSFGTFLVVDKKERIGRNPKTKVEAKIVARKVVKFKPSNTVKEKLNRQ